MDLSICQGTGGFSCPGACGDSSCSSEASRGTAVSTFASGLHHATAAALVPGCDLLVAAVQQAPPTPSTDLLFLGAQGDVTSKVSVVGIDPVLAATADGALLATTSPLGLSQVGAGQVTPLSFAPAGVGSIWSLTGDGSQMIAVGSAVDRVGLVGPLLLAWLGLDGSVASGFFPVPGATSGSVPFVQPTAEGAVVLTSRRSVSDGFDLWYQRLDRSGISTGESKVGKGYGQDYEVQALPMNDGGLLVASGGGGATAFVSLLRLDADGKVKGETDLPPNYSGGSLIRLRLARSGGHVLLAAATSGGTYLWTFPDGEITQAVAGTLLASSAELPWLGVLAGDLRLVRVGSTDLGLALDTLRGCF